MNLKVSNIGESLVSFPTWAEYNQQIVKQCFAVVQPITWLLYTVCVCDIHLGICGKLPDSLAFLSPGVPAHS